MAGVRYLEAFTNTLMIENITSIILAEKNFLMP